MSLIAMTHDLLPTCRAAALDNGGSDGILRWRIDHVWGDGVGILGGPPKCAKSWFGLDMASSLASGTPFLDHFPVRDPGPALIYLAEDALPQVHARVAGICLHRGVDLSTLDVHVITAAAVRLDQIPDQKRLAATLEHLRPKLLLLEPLVRLHRLDENSSADISALLGYLRELQRRYDVAIVLVHHMRKSVRAHLGQALRGSGDLHAWTDHAAYLTRTGHNGERLRLTLEHRSAPALWVPFQTMLPAALATELLRFAANTNLRKFKRHPRGPKTPVPKRTRVVDETHVSTARLLAKSRKK